MLVEENAPLSIALIKKAADAGDSEAINSFAEAGTAMGQGFAVMVNFFNPEKIILGGPLSLAGDYLLPSIRKTVSLRSLPEINQQVDIGLSVFGPDASLIGAAAILRNPTHIERRR